MKDKALKVLFSMGAIALVVALAVAVLPGIASGQDPGDLVINISDEFGNTGPVAGASVTIKSTNSDMIDVMDGDNNDADGSVNGKIVLTKTFLASKKVLPNDSWVIGLAYKTNFIQATINFGGTYSVGVVNYASASLKYPLKVLVRDELGRVWNGDKGRVGPVGEDGWQGTAGINLTFNGNVPTVSPGAGTDLKSGLYAFAVPDGSGKLEATDPGNRYAKTSEFVDPALGRITVRAQAGQTYIIMDRGPGKSWISFDSGWPGPGESHVHGLVYPLRVTVRDVFWNYLAVKKKDIGLGGVKPHISVEGRMGDDDTSDTWYWIASGLPTTSAELTVKKDGYTKIGAGVSDVYKDITVTPTTGPVRIELAGWGLHNPTVKSSTTKTHCFWTTEDEWWNKGLSGPLRGILFNLMVEVKNELGKGIGLDPSYLVWAGSTPTAVAGNWAGWASMNTQYPRSLTPAQPAIVDKLIVAVPGYFPKEYANVAAGTHADGASVIHLDSSTGGTNYGASGTGGWGVEKHLEPISYRLVVKGVYDELGAKFASAALKRADKKNPATDSTTTLALGYRVDADPGKGVDTDYTVAVSYSAGNVDYYNSTVGLNAGVGGDMAYVEALGPGTITITCPGYVKTTMDIPSLPDFAHREVEFKDGYALKYAYKIVVTNEMGEAINDATIRWVRKDYEDVVVTTNPYVQKSPATNEYYLRTNDGRNVKVEKAGYVRVLLTDDVPFTKDTLRQTVKEVTLPFTVKVAIFDELGKAVSDATVKIGAVDYYKTFTKEGRDYYAFTATAAGELKAFRKGYADFASGPTNIVTPDPKKETIITLAPGGSNKPISGGTAMFEPMRYIIKVEARSAADPSVYVKSFRLDIKKSDGTLLATVIDGQPEDADGRTDGIIYYALDNSATIPNAIFEARKGPIPVTVIRDVIATGAGAGQVQISFMIQVIDERAPVVAFTYPDPAARYVNSATITVRGTVDLTDEPSQPVTIDVYVGTAKVGSVSVGSATAPETGIKEWSVANVGLAAGSNTIKAVATDNAGNIATVIVTVVVDTAKPDAPTITSPADGTKTKATAVDVGGTVTVAPDESLPVTITVYVDGVAKGTTTVNQVGTGLVWTVTGVALTGNKVNSITATAKDAATNESAASAAVSVTSDQTAPGVPVIVSPADGAATKKVVDVSGTGATDVLSPPVKVKVLVGGVEVKEVTAAADGTFAAAGIELVAGANEIRAKAIDAVGNESAVSAAVMVTAYVLAKPAITKTTVVGMKCTVEGKVDITNAKWPVSVTIYAKPKLGVERPYTATVEGDGSFKADVSVFSGENTIRAVAQDGVGNKMESDPVTVIVGVPTFSVVAARTTPAASDPKAGYVWKATQKVQMKVYATGLVNINAAGFVLGYDPALLKVVEVIGGVKFGEPIYVETDGKLDVSVAVLGEGLSVTGDTTLAVVTFELLSDAATVTSPLTLSNAKAFDIEGNEIPAKVEAGSVKVIKLLGDFNGDGAVNIADLAILKKYYGKAVGATLPDGTKVPTDQIKAGMKIDDPPAGDGKWDIYELRMLASEWGWDYKVLRAPDPGTVDAEGRFLSPVFRGIGLKPERSQIAVGETARVELWVDAGGMAVGRAVIKYDPAKLQLVGAVGGEGLPFVNVAPGAGTITVDFAPMGGAIGKVATLTFKAVGAGYPGLKVESSTMWDLVGNEISGPVAEADLVIGSAELAAKERSEIIKLELGALYPNPASGSVTVPILSPKGAMATITIATVSGQAVRSQTVALKPGVNQITVDLSGIASGTYRVMVKVDGQSLVRNLAVR